MNHPRMAIRSERMGRWWVETFFSLKVTSETVNCHNHSQSKASLPFISEPDRKPHKVSLLLSKGRSQVWILCGPMPSNLTQTFVVTRGWILITSPVASPAGQTSTSNGWIRTFGKDIRVSKTFPLAPSSAQNLNLSNNLVYDKIPAKLMAFP